MISELILGSRFVVANSPLQLVALLLSGPLRYSGWGRALAMLFLHVSGVSCGLVHPDSWKPGFLLEDMPIGSQTNAFGGA